MTGEVPFVLRARRLYLDAGQKLEPLDTGVLTTQQVRAMQRAVKQGRAEGRITVADAAGELKMLSAMRRKLDSEHGPRQVSAQFAAAEDEFAVRRRRGPGRDQHRVERKARKAGRGQK